MFCPNCGKDNGPNYKFCADCGSDLSPGAALLGTTPRPADSPPGGVPPGGTRPMPPGDAGPVAPPPISGGTAGGWGGPKPPDPFSTPSSPVPPPPGGGFPSAPGGPGGWPPPSSSPGGGQADSWSAPSPSSYGDSPTPTGSRFPLPAVIAVVAVVVVLLGFGLFKMMKSGKAGASPSPATTPTTVATASTPGTWGGTSSSSSSGGGATSASVTVRDVIVCKGFSRLRGAPENPTTTFGPSETFRCGVRLDGVHTGQRVTGAWKGPGCDTGKNLTTDRFGTWVGRFEAQPSGSWQTGRYTFTLTVDGSVLRTVDFEVTGSAASGPATPATAQTGPASGVIQEVTMCKSIGSGYQAVDPTSVFGSSDTFRCVVTVNGAKAGQTIQSRWYQGQGHLTQLTYPVKSDGSGHVKFELPPRRGSWSTGAYRVEILVDGTLGRSAVFEVR